MIGLSFPLSPLGLWLRDAMEREWDIRASRALISS